MKNIPHQLCSLTQNLFTCQRNIRRKVSSSKLVESLIIPLEHPGQRKEIHLSLDLCGTVDLPISVVPAFQWLLSGFYRFPTQRFLSYLSEDCFFFDILGFLVPITDEVALSYFFSIHYCFLVPVVLSQCIRLVVKNIIEIVFTCL